MGAVFGAKPNPLWHVTVTCHGASKVANIDLGLDSAVGICKESQKEIRKAAREYLGSVLIDGEGIRCWFGFSGNPRINLWLKRKSGQINVEFENADVISRIQHWCSRASVPLF